MMFSASSISLLVAVFILSWVLTWGIYRLALAKKILDIPNERSSHQQPTPRGGGLAFVIGFLVTLPLLTYFSYLSWPICVSLMIAGVVLAILGFLDDIASIKPIWRLLGHILVASELLFTLGGMPAIRLLGITWEPGLVLNGCALMYLVWMLNLYNFMDGIDGIASIQTITVCLGAVLLYALVGLYELMPFPIILATAVGGFLCWNFPPARIFMGDAGSGFLGIFLGFFSLQAASVMPVLIWSWLILLGVFIVDATLTLSQRLIAKVPVYQPHRTHAYQHASNYFNSHLPITLGVGIINVVWLWPCAVLVALGHIDGFLGMLLAYAPLVLLAFKLDAGKKKR